MFNRVIIKGAAPGGEVWSSGFAVTSGDDNIPSTTAELQLWAENIGVIISAWTSSNQLRKCLSNSLFVSAVRCEFRDEDESLVNMAEVALVPPLQGSQALAHSLTSAAVVSLQTNTPGGRGRGRMFWPNLTFVPNPDGRIDDSLCIALVTDMRTFIGNVIASLEPAFTVELVVRSVTDHTSRLVVALRVGDVPDTQRRRRDDLVEVYHAVPFP